MKSISFIFILFASVLVFGEAKDFQVVSPQNDAVTASRFTANFSYTIPADNELLAAAKNNPAMKPATVIWLWGDEEQGTTTRNFTAVAYDGKQAVQHASHVYKKPGNYSVMVLVNDTKNRNIVQAAIAIKVSLPVEVQ